MKWIAMFLLPMLAACNEAVPSGSGDVAWGSARTAAAAQASLSDDAVGDRGHAPVIAGDGTEMATPAASSSRYSSIAEADCALVRLGEELASSTSRCPGPDGYQLRVLDSDGRMSIDVIAPDGSQHPLVLWSVVSTGFSRLGGKVEWRYPVASQVPEALIVRFVAGESADHSGPRSATSYLVVARLSGQPVCVIGKVAPGPRQNERARQLADRAATMACLHAGDQAGGESDG